MALSLDQLKQQIEDLRTQYTNLTARPAALFQVDNIRDAQAAVDTLTRSVNQVIQDARALDEGFGGIADSVKAIVDELGKSQTPLNLARNAFKAIEESARKLKYDQQGLSDLNKKQLENEIKKQRIAQQAVRDQAMRIMQDNSLLTLSGGMLENALARRIAAGQISEEEAGIVRAAKEGFPIFDEINNKIQARLDKEKEIQKALGLTGKAAGLLGKIPFFGEGAAEALRDTEEEIRALDRAGQPVPGRFKTMGMMVKNMKGSIKETLTDPLVLGTALISALVKGFLDSDKAAVGLQKTLNISAGEARDINMEFSAFALSVDNVLVNSRSMAATFGAIQSKLGSVGKVSGDTAATFARLNKSVGLTEEEAAGIVTQSNAFGKSSNEVYKSVLGTTQEVSRQYKTNINQKAVLADIGKTSAYTLVQFRGSTTALAEGIAKAKALGLEMNTLKNISSGLLNFQQSIEDELAAELLTGKQLNLEQARYYALTNQQSKLMDELQTQIGNYSDFTKLNVVQQEAYAKSLGMTTDQLSEMLFKQEYMKNTAQEQAMTDEERIQKQIEAITLQEKFQAAVEKLQATFADFVAGPLGSVLTNMTAIYTIVGLIATTITTRLVTSLAMSAAAMGLFGAKAKQAAVANIANAGASVVQSASAVPVVGWIAGIAGAIGLIATLTAALTADDLYSPGKSGYGKRMLIAPEGTFALNDKDNIIATTNPIDVNDMISGPAGKFNLSTPSAATKSSQAQINVAPADTRISLNLNGAALGNATARQSYQVGNTVKALGGAVDYSAPL